MKLRPDFQFSQNNLQDYLDCPRRFLLRHAQKVAWPALESQPALEQEQQIRQGARFHELVYQHQCHLPVEELGQTIREPELAAWWQAYLNCEQLDLPSRRYAEFTLHASLAGYRVVARFDLLAVEPGQRAVIVDWKTAQRRPLLSHLEARVQTHLYPLMLAAAGACLNQGRPFQPEQIEMIYWFPRFPDRPEHFCYTREQYDRDCRDLTQRIVEILDCQESEFGMAQDEKVCRFCAYRSLCERGSVAGSLTDWDHDQESDAGLNDFDLSLSPEINF